jgi:hypothetical protein
MASPGGAKLINNRRNAGTAKAEEPAGAICLVNQDRRTALGEVCYRTEI